MDNDPQLVMLQVKLDNHIEDFHKHCEEESERWDHLIVAQERNTQSIKELTESTRDLVGVWQAAAGTIKTMAAVGRFVKWLSSFALIGVAIDWVVTHFK